MNFLIVFSYRIIFERKLYIKFLLSLFDWVGILMGRGYVIYVGVSLDFYGYSMKNIMLKNN